MTTELFSELDLLPSLQATLKENRWKRMTEIQSRALPALLDGKSIIGVSETGSGKTLAFVLPLLHKLKHLENQGQTVELHSRPRAAVIVPTRELGEQVSKVFKIFTHGTRLRVRSILGGTTLEVAKNNIKGPFEILVATPGRLVQLMNRRLISLSDVSLLIFDEADQMLDQGFIADAHKIVEACLPKRQLGLFSATVSNQVQELIDQLFSGAEEIRSQGSHRVVSTLKTIIRSVLDGKRFPLLETILSQPSHGGTLIFTNTREQCDVLVALLKEKKTPCVIYRGEMDKVERRNNLKSFRDGQINLLVSTDLASRGLDVDHVSRVINYHMPKEMNVYLHRVGRTARAGRPGTVVNFVTERDENLVSRLGSGKL